MIALAMAAELTRFVLLRVRVNAYGVPGNGIIVVDRLDGRFSRRFNAGPASEQEGFDGKRAWRADATGMPRVEGNSGERAEIAGWASALRHAFNSKTPQHAQVAGATDRVKIDFERYTKHGALSLPARIVSRSQQNGMWTATVTSVETRANISPQTFAPPKPVRDFRLTGITQIPVSMDSGSPVIEVRVNGKPLHFLVDTGGQNVITTSAAKRIGLRVMGRGIVGGGGGGTVTIRYATAGSVQTGSAVMYRQPFIVLPDEALPPVDGIVGYELLARFAARLDMVRDSLELAPDASRFGHPVQPASFQYDDRQPQVNGSLDGLGGAITIDTGSTLTAQIQVPFVRNHNLVQRLHATVRAYANDVGGRYLIYLVRAHSVHLGSAIFPNPIVDLLTNAITSNNASIAANAGDGILRRWIIVSDYAHQELDFRPGGDTRGNVIHDRSGIVLRTKSNVIVAAQVLGGTPASRAGLADGAQIAAINGEAVGAHDLERVRKMLQGSPGTQLVLQLSDGSQHTLVLEKYL